jgi:hypothetical protein
MPRFIKENKILIFTLYSYSVLHIMGWVMYGYSNHNETWFPLFKALYTYIFFPLHLLTFTFAYRIWGTANVISARFLVGPVTDFAVFSLISASLLILAVIIIKGLACRLAAFWHARRADKGPEPKI